ncbi:guanylate kinase [Ruminococcus champanellensis]|uniref:Guanylate kinase n=1 Tax=Ruminococcus champanellensis (strain DSM 18848 / JCM 17042 / KCTC 15320 / 18P13) TaxID=213810 RepID=D4LBM2_RUMC1|nr:guanylate kinase [Ruminococcus champanellensis]CBL17017.1 guanylate kinase [Ruminococcus champanellensis 18P13 = JCM 17042]
MKNKGLLLVVSAPSGCGKGTILGEILKDDSFYYSISATTRAPREGEQDGVNYHFITKEEFEQRIAQGGMLEYAQYCGNYYGTPKKEVEQMRDAGRDVILEIEVEGAMKVRALCPDAVFLFIAPPSVEELRRRLNKRGTEAAEVIEERVSQAARELSYADRYDYIIVNGELEKAIQDFRTVVRAEKLRTKNGNKIDEVLNHA